MGNGKGLERDEILQTRRERERERGDEETRREKGDEETTTCGVSEDYKTKFDH